MAGFPGFDWEGVPGWVKAIGLIGLPSVFSVILLLFVLHIEDKKMDTLATAVTNAATQTHQDNVDSNGVLEKYVASNSLIVHEFAGDRIKLNQLIAVAQQTCIIQAKGNADKIDHCITADVPLTKEDLPAY